MNWRPFLIGIPLALVLWAGACRMAFGADWLVAFGWLAIIIMATALAVAVGVVAAEWIHEAIERTVDREFVELPDDVPYLPHYRTRHHVEGDVA